MMLVQAAFHWCCVYSVYHSIKSACFQKFGLAPSITMLPPDLPVNAVSLQKEQYVTEYIWDVKVPGKYSTSLQTLELHAVLCSVY